ncbi:uncharacterized protein BO80DRAFT_447297 [Aspergillus ibericus CBS 121593]|uniref:Uncharacterized protein n=1 Tax=Aspergillus ibericus CBS 121593 TaxID=1448316 RepID=A0A395GVF6_9EURO|nr:hypothetical protein BO80DRAFT_447297 [Aspergillus ibericus CBS 121593]RAK98667.1 hypothetical protein BO80DRAFT_447297 [Aspergillus ibericus CBS 121593]
MTESFENGSAHLDDAPRLSSLEQLPSLHVARTRSITAPRTADSLAAQQTLETAIPRILSQDMDLLGYRKMQRIILSNDRLFDTEEQYEEYLDALLAELERAPEAKLQGSRRLADFKTQVLVTVQYTFRHIKRLVDRSSTMEIGRFSYRIVKALIRARVHYDKSCHLALDLPDTAMEVIGVADQVEVVDTLVIMMTEEELNARSLCMGLNLLTTVLRHMNTERNRLPHELVDKIGEPVSKYLTSNRVGLRQAATEVCVQLRKMVGDEEEFWQVLREPTENTRRLLTYYLAR